MSKRRTLTRYANRRGSTEALRAQGATVYRHYDDVPETLATATTLYGRNLVVMDDTPVQGYVLSGDAKYRYMLFDVNDSTLTSRKRRAVKSEAQP